MTYEGYWWDIVWRYHCKSNFQLHFYYQTIDRVVLKTFFWLLFFYFIWFIYSLFFFLVIFTDLAKSHLILLTNQYVRKLILLRYICRIILKLTFLLQLFSKFRENVIWPVKSKPTIPAKIFFRETRKGLCIETVNSAYFEGFTIDFGKVITLSGKILLGKTFVGKNVCHLAKISYIFSNESFYLLILCKFYGTLWLCFFTMEILWICFNESL